VTSVPAVLALIAKCVEKELVAKGAENNLVELLLDELVAVHLVHFALAFTDGALASETTRIERPLTNILLDCRMR
jgi:hypothetical protein